MIVKTFQFFYNSAFSDQSWQNPASLDREEQNKKNSPCRGVDPGPRDHHANALLNELSQHLVVSLNHHGLKKVMFC